MSVTTRRCRSTGVLPRVGIDRPERIFSYRHPIGWNVGRGSYADTTPHPDSWRGRHVNVCDKHPEVGQGRSSTARVHTWPGLPQRAPHVNLPFYG